MKKTDCSKSKFGTFTCVKTTASYVLRVHSNTTNLRMDRVLRRLPAKDLAQEKPKIVVACSQEPDHVDGLYKIKLNVIYCLYSCHDLGVCSCQFGVYCLLESGRAHGRDATQDNVPCYEKDVKNLSPSADTASALIQLYDEKQMKQILPGMAANVQILKSKEAKKSQVHLLCLGLTALLERSKQ